MPENDVIDGRVLAQLFGCSYQQIMKQTERGQLPCFRIGSLVRFRRSDIEKFMEDQINMKPKDEALKTKA